MGLGLWTIRCEPLTVDLSTHETATANDRLPDKTWEQQGFQFPRGDGSIIVRAAFAQALLLQLNYMLSPRCEDEILSEPEAQPDLSW